MFNLCLMNGEVTPFTLVIFGQNIFLFHSIETP